MAQICHTLILQTFIILPTTIRFANVHFPSNVVPAVAVVGEDNVTVVEGQPVNLTCQATGDPPPIITWYVWYPMSINNYFHSRTCAKQFCL